MSADIGLLALRCPNCQTPVPAQPNEVAWVCANCGRGLLLHDIQGIEEIDIKYTHIEANKTGRPFWVIPGEVTLFRDARFSLSNKDKEAKAFWEGKRPFFIPAYETDIDDLIKTALDMMNRQMKLGLGDPVPFSPVTLGQADLQAYAEYIVVAIEALRKDKIKDIDFTIALDQPELWIFP